DAEGTGADGRSGPAEPPAAGRDQDSVGDESPGDAPEDDADDGQAGERTRVRRVEAVGLLQVRRAPGEPEDIGPGAEELLAAEADDREAGEHRGRADVATVGADRGIGSEQGTLLGVRPVMLVGSIAEPGEEPGTPDQPGGRVDEEAPGPVETRE